ncbi:MAG: hypothetical protein KDK36_12305, partial [Leptospiraceae bacterium]|nr:hypothetical protein [Leptospiraceae bacterium]
EKVIKIYLHTIEDSTINDNQTSDKFHILKFEDNGKGIEKEKLNLIFDPFYTDKKGEGTGLGLSIIYGIVKRMNGEIQVFSTKNKGSIFSLYLPAEDPPKLNLP